MSLKKDTNSYSEQVIGNKTKSSVKLPMIVIPDLSLEEIDLWRTMYAKTPSGQSDYRTEEGLWRRTQESLNKEESGWLSENDKRRRIIHYQLQFKVAKHKTHGPSLMLKSLYLWWHVTSPENEIDQYKAGILSGIKTGKWKNIFSIGGSKLWRNGDLLLSLEETKPGDNVFDEAAGRVFPPGYKTLEAKIFSQGMSKDADFINKPWHILSTGIRQKDVRGNPEIDQWESVKKFLPAQVEIGCGPSIESGVPPLHFLHDVFRVTDKETNKFILDPERDTLVKDVALDPIRMLTKFSEMYGICFKAKPSKFHFLLKSLHDRGFVVGPVITNNFDRLVNKIGLQELYVRRYEDVHIIPKIDFHPEARSLIVVGSHADRRRIQQAARKKGLKLIYIDPEGYHENGIFRPYLLESPQDGDILLHSGASEAMEKIMQSI